MGCCDRDLDSYYAGGPLFNIDADEDSIDGRVIILFGDVKPHPLFPKNLRYATQKVSRFPEAGLVALAATLAGSDLKTVR